MIPWSSSQFNYQSVSTAETIVIDGIEYENIELGSDSVQNKNKISTDKNGNFRYIMTADWTFSTGLFLIYFFGKNVIFDFNGYTVTVNGWSPEGDHSYFMAKSTYFEITDSSPTQTGAIISSSGIEPGFSVESGVHEVVISGGTFFTAVNLHTDCVISLLGGVYKTRTGGFLLPFPDVKVISLTVAPWVKVVANINNVYPNYIVEKSITYSHFAISTSNLVSGVSNTVYGYQWDITAKALLDLTLPTDKVYYLWGRNLDGWYEFLDLRCTDGKNWVQS